jgi:TonB family protein
MRNLTTLFFFLLTNFLLSAQQKNQDFVVIITHDTISIKDLLSHRYFRVVSTPDTFYLGENGHVFDNSKVDRRVDYPGGNNGLKKYLSENIMYPPLARQRNISGTVVIKFVVDEYGKSVQPIVFKSIDPMLDAEALRVVSSINNWIPAVVSGKSVRSYFALPISFNLE